MSLFARRPSPRRSHWYRWFPDAAIVLFCLTMALMLWMLDAREADQQLATLARDVQWAEQTVQLRVEDDVGLLSDMAYGAGRGDLSETEFMVRVKEAMANAPELVAAYRLDGDGRLQWAAPHREESRVLDRVLAEQGRRLIAEMRVGGRAVFSTPYRSDDGAHLALLVPVVQNGYFAGMVVGLFSLDGMVRRLPPAWLAERYRIVLEDGDGRRWASMGSSRALASQSGTLQLPGTGLHFRVTPLRSSLPQASLLQYGLTGGLMLLTLLSLFTMKRHLRRRLEAEADRDRVYTLSREMLGVIAADTSIREVNPAFAHTLGYAAAELCGRSFLDYLAEEDRATAREAFALLLAGHPSERFLETRLFTRQQGTRWVVWAVSPLPERGVAYVSGRDITQEKLAEQALRREFAFRKAMEDSLSVGVRAIDRDGRISYVNPAFCAITGYSEGELIGIAPPYPYWPPGEEGEASYARLRQTLQGGVPDSGHELVLQRKNGERFFAHMLLSPLIDADGQHTGWMAALTDVTEREEAKRRLEAAHQRFVTVVEGLDAAVAVFDPEHGELFFCNERYRHWFGAGDDAALCDVQLVRIVEGRPQDFECQWPGGERWLAVRRRPIRWVNGRDAEMVLLADVSAQHEAEERYQQQVQKMQANGRLVTMGEMASTLAHELGQPLSAIANYQAGCMERLRQGKASVESLLPVMEKVAAQAQRAGTIVRRVRDFVKQSEPVRRRCQLADIMEATLAIADIEARRQGAAIRVQLPAGLPPLSVDALLVEQVLLNLIKNGIDAMREVPPARRVLRIQARLVSVRRLELAIVDQGCGVPDDIKARLFDAFFTTKPDGLGMGLNICRTIVEFHQGQLWVEDNPAGGSIFKLTLPVSDDHE